MTMTATVARWGGARVSRRLARSVPFFGAIVAIALLGVAVRRKGWFGGTVDTTLNAIPFVGALKTAVEVVRGRDLIADKRGMARG
jgi:hypothetical protein